MDQRRHGVARAALACSLVMVAVGAVAPPGGAQGTIGAVDDPCISASGTPSAGSASVAGVEMGTPVAADAAATPASDPAAVDLDLLYIDLMIPHHSGIAAVAQAAKTRVQDERLQELAASIVESRNAEISELQALRDRLYPGSEPMPVDTVTMTAMDMATPGASIPMAQTIVDYDLAGMLAIICDAADADRAFIDLAIPHDRIAIDLSNALVSAAAHDDVRALAERVIRDRQSEIAALAGIRENLYGSAAPEPVGPGS